SVYYVSLPIVLALGPVRAYAVTLALHLLVFAGGSVWFLVRRGLRTRAAVFGALAAMLSGFIGTHVHLPMVVHVAAYFPWLLLAIEWLIERRTWRAAGVFALVTGLSLLAGFPQVALIQLAGVLAYGVFHAWRCGRETWRAGSALKLAAALLCGAALSAIHLLPATELLRHSLRREALARAPARGGARARAARRSLAAASVRGAGGGGGSARSLAAAARRPADLEGVARPCRARRQAGARRAEQLRREHRVRGSARAAA